MKNLVFVIARSPPAGKRRGRRYEVASPPGGNLVSKFGLLVVIFSGSCRLTARHCDLLSIVAGAQWGLCTKCERESSGLTGGAPSVATPQKLLNLFTF